MAYQVFLIYGALVWVVYLATDGFQNNAPFIFTIPVIVLGILTFSTHMPKRKKALTSLSFFMLVTALYHWSVFPKKLELSGLMICASHITYLFSFYRSLRKWWTGLALITLPAMALFLYAIFEDIFRSLPILVTILCLTIFILSFSFVASGSVWKNGSMSKYEEKTALVRFVGMFFLLVCNSALLINHFASHTKAVVLYLNFTYYISQYLLFESNVAAF
uniref:lysoplasmalogenase n=1 Tax=Ditylenchus dipsaci TaxID=166011 RepID=A0A915DFG1_9BILA